MISDDPDFDERDQLVPNGCVTPPVPATLDRLRPDSCAALPDTPSTSKPSPAPVMVRDRTFSFTSGCSMLVTTKFHIAVTLFTWFVFHG